MFLIKYLALKKNRHASCEISKKKKIAIIQKRCHITDEGGKMSGVLYGIFNNIHFYHLFIYFNHKYWSQRNKDTLPLPFLNLHKGMWQKYLYNTSLLLGRNQRTQSWRHFFSYLELPEINMVLFPFRLRNRPAVVRSGCFTAPRDEWLHSVCFGEGFPHWPALVRRSQPGRSPPNPGIEHWGPPFCPSPFPSLTDTGSAPDYSSTK